MPVSTGAHIANFFSGQDSNSDGTIDKVTTATVDVGSTTLTSLPSNLGAAMVYIGSYSNTTNAGLTLHDFQNIFSADYERYFITYELWRSPDAVDTSDAHVCIAIDDGTSTPAYNNNTFNNSTAGRQQRMYNGDSRPLYYNEMNNATYKYARIGTENNDTISGGWSGMVGEMTLWHPYRTDSIRNVIGFGQWVNRTNSNATYMWRNEHSFMFGPLNSTVPSTGFRIWMGNHDMASNLIASNFKANCYALRTS
tara:strand:+ start:492 stop:1247 length:756 start_codon:yes stop_codon:yes gene_type:complete